MPSVLDLEDADLVVQRVPALVESQAFERKQEVGSGERVANGIPLGRDGAAGHLLQRRQDGTGRRVALHAERRRRMIELPGESGLVGATALQIPGQRHPRLPDNRS